jgi:very-short-patch-repair endonuclease
MYFHVMDWNQLVKSQGGIVQFHQLRELGVTGRRLAHLLTSQELVRLGPAVYGLPDPADPWLQRLRAIQLRAGPDAVVWRRSAARWWGLDGLDRSEAIEVAAGPSGRRGDRRVSRLRRKLEVTTERGLLVTTVAQTLLDVGPVTGADLVERALEDGLRRGAVDLDSLRRLAMSTPRWGGVLKEVLDRRPAGAPPTESDAETLFLQLVRRGGLPVPTRQFPVVIRGRRVRLDFAWPGPGLAAEVDGARFHGDDALGRDLRRQNALILGGWRILRYTFVDVARYGDEVIETLWDWFS